MTISTMPLRPETALNFWPEIVPYIEKALALDPVNMATVDSIQAQLASNEAMVFVCSEGDQLLAATVCQLIAQKEGMQTLHILTSAGDQADGWLDSLIDTLMMHARKENAGFITTAGRPGWCKKFAGRGFIVSQVTMLRAVDNGVIQLRR